MHPLLNGDGVNTAHTSALTWGEVYQRAVLQARLRFGPIRSQVSSFPGTSWVLPLAEQLHYKPGLGPAQRPFHEH